MSILALAPTLVLIAWFVHVDASIESRTTVLRGLLRGINVRGSLSDAGLPRGPADVPAARRHV